MRILVFFICVVQLLGCSNSKGNGKYDKYTYTKTLKNIDCIQKAAYKILYADSLKNKSSISIPLDSFDCKISSYTAKNRTSLSTGFLNDDVYLIEIDRFFKNTFREGFSNRNRLEIHRLLFSKSKKELDYFLIGKETLEFIEMLSEGCYYQVTSSILTSRY